MFFKEHSQCKIGNENCSSAIFGTRSDDELVCFHGQGGDDDKPNQQDWGKGSGNGHGKRDLEKEDTGGFKSKVKAKMQRGETVVTGNADGENITGRSASETRELVKASISEDSDPLENQRLPKAQREHVREYFEKLRKK